MMKLLIASDHAAFEVKKNIINHYSQYHWMDLGCTSQESVDYPDFAKKLCKELLKNPSYTYGILICGTGIGMSITANRFPKIRAALCTSTKMAEMSKKHNNANVLVLGSRILNQESMFEIIQTFIETSFEGGRHEKRIQKMDV